jgi:hypothetical protein
MIMKKRIIAFMAILAIAASMTGCGKKTSKSQIDDSNSPSATQAASSEDGSTAAPAEKSAEQVQNELDNFAKDADKSADIKKIDGTDLKSDNSSDGKAELSGYEVEIKDAVKTKDSDGADVLVVEYSFKNNTSETTKFDSVIKTTVTQGERILPYAITYSAEGYNIETIAQDVEHGKKINVQRAFKLVSDSEDATVSVQLTDTIGSSDPVTKTFKLN